MDVGYRARHLLYQKWVLVVLPDVTIEVYVGYSSERQPEVILVVGYLPNDIRIIGKSGVSISVI